MSIRRKLNLGYIAIGIIFLMSIGFATVQFLRIGDEVSKSVDVQMAQIQCINKACTASRYKVEKPSSYTITVQKEGFYYCPIEFNSPSSATGANTSI